MILSFSVFREKIESGEKRQTIRKFSPRQWKIAQNAKKYQLYWHNPRNGGTLIKEVERSKEPELIQFCQYDSFVGKDNRFKRVINTVIDANTGDAIPMFKLAKDDGFENDFDMWDWFYQEYCEQMFQEKFIVYRW